MNKKTKGLLFYMYNNDNIYRAKYTTKLQCGVKAKGEQDESTSGRVLKVTDCHNHHK